MQFQKYPSFRYRRLANGDIESRIFDAEPIEPGWKDSPAKVDIPEEVKPPIAPLKAPMDEDMGIDEAEKPQPKTRRRKRKS